MKRNVCKSYHLVVPSSTGDGSPYDVCRPRRISEYVLQGAAACLQPTRERVASSPHHRLRRHGPPSRTSRPRTETSTLLCTRGTRSTRCGALGGYTCSCCRKRNSFFVISPLAYGRMLLHVYCCLRLLYYCFLLIATPWHAAELRGVRARRRSSSPLDGGWRADDVYGARSIPVQRAAYL